MSDSECVGVSVHIKAFNKPGNEISHHVDWMVSGESDLHSLPHQPTKKFGTQHGHSTDKISGRDGYW